MKCFWSVVFVSTRLMSAAADSVLCSCLAASYDDGDAEKESISFQFSVFIF